MKYWKIKSEKYLGIKISKNLRWGDHMNTVARKGLRSFHFASRVLKKRSREAKLLLF